MAASVVKPAYAGNIDRQRKIIDLMLAEGYPMSASSVAYMLKFPNGFSDAIKELRAMSGTRVEQYQAGRTQMWRTLPGCEIGLLEVPNAV